MKRIKDTTWKDVFVRWKHREAGNPGWVRTATEIKGWPDWESWRSCTARQFKAEDRDWSVFGFTDPMNEVPKMLIGPFGSWQSRLPEPNVATFADLLDIPEQYEIFSNHGAIRSILNGMPFETEFIGLLREDNERIVCLEGHHRATAIALARKNKKPIDFSNVHITISLARLPATEVHLLDTMLKMGTTKP